MPRLHQVRRRFCILVTVPLLLTLVATYCVQVAAASTPPNADSAFVHSIARAPSASSTRNWFGFSNPLATIATGAAVSCRPARGSVLASIESRQSGAWLLFSTGRVDSCARAATSRGGMSMNAETCAPKIIIAGAPASGKGTQCNMIKERYGVVHLSTGDSLVLVFHTIITVVL